MHAIEKEVAKHRQRAIARNGATINTNSLTSAGGRGLAALHSTQARTTADLFVTL